MSFDTDRRAFLVGIVRWLVAGGGVATVASLSAKPGERCARMGVCDGCGAAERCGLPQALSYRDARSTRTAGPAREGDG